MTYIYTDTNPITLPCSLARAGKKGEEEIRGGHKKEGKKKKCKSREKGREEKKKSDRKKHLNPCQKLKSKGGGRRREKRNLSTESNPSPTDERTQRPVMC